MSSLVKIFEPVALIAGIATLFPNCLYAWASETIILNDSRVINSRFFFSNSNKNVIEILVTNIIDIRQEKKKIIEAEGLIGNSKKWKEDEILISKNKSIILEVQKKKSKNIL